MSLQFDSLRLKKRIAEALEKTYTQADPKLLSQYRSIFKKEVSFFRRSYFTAYLLMEMDQGGNGKSSASRERSSRKFQKTFQEKDEGNRRENRRVLPDEESAQLYIGIGRGRRVFPREILGLIASKTPVSRDDIGAIRIFENYSFIQVKSAAADEIIEALNGKPFRGRTLVVSYARNRKDGMKPADEEEEGAASLPADGDYPAEEPDGQEEEDYLSVQEDKDSSGKEDV